MNAIRLVYDAVPDSLPVPPVMRHRRVEVVFLALDEEAAAVPAEALGTEWREGFFEQTASALPDLPERDDQGRHPSREPLA